jgi:hypothetical protein
MEEEPAMSARDALAIALLDVWRLPLADRPDAILAALHAMPIAARLAFAREIAGKDWAVVPRVQTDEMCCAGAEAIIAANAGDDAEWMAGACWPAMLAASEKEPGQ